MACLPTCSSFFLFGLSFYSFLMGRLWCFGLMTTVSTSDIFVKIYVKDASFDRSMIKLLEPVNGFFLFVLNRFKNLCCFRCPIQILVINSLLTTGVFTSFRIMMVVLRMILICDVVFRLVFMYIVLCFCEEIIDSDSDRTQNLIQTKCLALPS